MLYHKLDWISSYFASCTVKQKTALMSEQLIPASTPGVAHSVECGMV